jgi:hypothetical protein
MTASSDQIEQIVELKSQAEAIRVYTVQKQLGHDAELAAAEVVHRAERCIGLAIRKGQAEGRFTKNARHGVHDADSIAPAVVAPAPRGRPLTRCRFALAARFEGRIDRDFARNQVESLEVTRGTSQGCARSLGLALVTR